MAGLRRYPTAYNPAGGTVVPYNFAAGASIEYYAGSLGANGTIYKLETCYENRRRAYQATGDQIDRDGYQGRQVCEIGRGFDAGSC